MLTRRFPLFFLSLMAAFYLSGCSSIEYKEGEFPRMLVTEDQTPLFHNGPAQGSGPDLYLSKGDEVSVLRKEFGYSVVKTSDGGKGYVDNEALIKVPPEPSRAQQSKKPRESMDAFQPSGELPGFRY